MTIVNINSGAVQDVEYHHKKHTLDVSFRDGTQSTYRNVPTNIYEQFLQAPSKGKYFNYNIRGVYEEA